MTDTNLWDWETGTKHIDLGGWGDRFNWVEDFAASPDGEKVAAIVNTDEAEFTVCLNGETWESTFEKAWSLSFLPDNRLAVLAANDEEWTVYTDDTPWENRFDYIWHLQWSEDGNHISVAVQQDMEYAMAVNDQPWDTLYENLTCPVLSRTGTTAAVVQKESLSQGDIEAYRKGIFSAAVNGNTFDAQFMNVWEPAFDSEGKNLAYVVRKSRTDYSLVQNTEIWPQNFQAAWKPLFTDQDRNLLAPVRKAGKWFLYKNGLPFWQTGYEQVWQQTSCPGSGEIAAVISPKYGRWTVRQNRKVWDVDADTMINGLCYSQDGSSLWALVKDRGSWDMVVNNKPWGLGADKLWQPAASSDSSVIAARMQRKGRYFLTVNGMIYPKSFDMVFDPVISPAGDKIMLKTIENNTYTRHILSLDDIG